MGLSCIFYIDYIFSFIFVIKHLSQEISLKRVIKKYIFQSTVEDCTKYNGCYYNASKILSLRVRLFLVVKHFYFSYRTHMITFSFYLYPPHSLVDYLKIQFFQFLYDVLIIVYTSILGLQAGALALMGGGVPTEAMQSINISILGQTNENVPLLQTITPLSTN